MAQDNDPNPGNNESVESVESVENLVRPAENSLAAVFERVGGHVKPTPHELAASADESSERVYGDVFSNLNELIKVCRDSESGFRECAHHSQADNLTELLNRHADETQANIEELQGFVREMGGKAESTGSVVGALQRGWATVRGTLAGHSPESLLAECERGQDALVTAYNTAQEKNLPEEVFEVVKQQAEGVRQNHARIQELRDSLNAQD